MWFEDANTEYFNLLEQYKDKIIIELSGHDHFSSLRAHESEEGGQFHNLFVAPSITPWYYNNPGVTSLEISEDLLPQNLHSTFLNLKPTIDQEFPLPQDELEFRKLDYAERYGIEKMTAEEIFALVERLLEDEDLHQDYLIRKMGLDPSIPSEVITARDILLRKKIILETEDGGYTLWPQVCLMTKNMTKEEYVDCLGLDPTSILQ